MAKQTQKQLYIISGYSGSGKTAALRFIEELDFYCVDNLPAKLLPELMNLVLINKNISRIAVVIDARGKDFLRDLEQNIDFVCSKFQTTFIFFDCSLQTIIRRYKESRLKHPLSLTGTIAQGYKYEQEALTHLRHHAQTIINTDNTNIHELKAKLHLLLAKKQDHFFEIKIISFGFKFGIPQEADIVLDVRFLNNPYFDPKLRNKTGQDKKVKKFIFEDKQTKTFINKTHPYIHYLASKYKNAAKTFVTIAFGCTGGQHRSVAVAEELGKILSVDHSCVNITHRDITKK
jgi:RNase adapter protein RapZ